MKKLYLISYYLLFKNLPPSHFPMGSVFNALRVKTLRRVIPIGSNTTIEPGFRFGMRDILKIGRNSQINENTYIQSAVIGDYVLIAQNVTILSVTHNHEDIQTPIRLQGSTPSLPVIVEDGVWIGRNAVIMPGLTLGKDCIIGAGAVVTKNVPPLAVVGGVPARLIRYRTGQPKKTT